MASAAVQSGLQLYLKQINESPLLTADQQTALASLGAASEYAVGLYRVAWDEGRRLWDGGRVLPVACGTVLLFEAADVTP